MKRNFLKLQDNPAFHGLVARRPWPERCRQFKSRFALALVRFSSRNGAESKVEQLSRFHPEVRDSIHPPGWMIAIESA